MPQLILLGVKCTTMTADATTAYPIPSWAPDIESIATTVAAGALPESWRSSTSAMLGFGGSGEAERFLRAGARCFLFSNATFNTKKTIMSVALRYQGVGEFVRT